MIRPLRDGDLIKIIRDVSAWCPVNQTPPVGYIDTVRELDVKDFIMLDEQGMVIPIDCVERVNKLNDYIGRVSSATKRLIKIVFDEEIE